jgi:phage portal protein BeeE
MVFDFLRRGAALAGAEAAVPEAPEVKASATGRVVAFATNGRVAWSPRDTVSLTKAGFLGNPIGFRAVKLIAEAAAALPASERGPRTRGVSGGGLWATDPDRERLS